jgi:hypothetical protein
MDRVITVDPTYLNEKSADVCRAILLHESAHCAITRIHHVYPVERRHLYQDLLNVLEDLRIESWLGAAFPGCAEWLRTANALIFQAVSNSKWPASYQIQFLRAILESAHSGEIPQGVAPVVRDALEETREAIAAQTLCHPGMARGRAAARETLNAQQRMLAIFDEKIRPVWERLVALDECEGRSRVTTLAAKQGFPTNGPQNQRITPAKRTKAGDGHSEAADTLKRGYMVRQRARLGMGVGRRAGQGRAAHHGQIGPVVAHGGGLAPV